MVPPASALASVPPSGHQPQPGQRTRPPCGSAASQALRVLAGTRGRARTVPQAVWLSVQAGLGGAGEPQWPWAARASARSLGGAGHVSAWSPQGTRERSREPEWLCPPHTLLPRGARVHPTPWFPARTGRRSTECMLNPGRRPVRGPASRCSLERLPSHCPSVALV